MKKLFFQIYTFFQKSFSRFVLLLTQPYRNYVLRKMIQGRRVLILGSGPSAAGLTHIPEDVLIFACNTSPQLLLNTNRRDIALYIGNRRLKLEPDRLQEVTTLLQNFTITIFLFRRPRFIKKHTNIQSYKKVFRERSTGGKDHYYTKKVIAPMKVRDVVGTSEQRSTSAGIGLLQYAEYYGAKEIYLLGIDLDGAVRISDNEGPVPYEKPHKDMDHNVVAVLVKKYNNIFVASKSSPLSAYSPYRELK